MLADIILESSIGAITELLHVRLVGQPGKAMDVGATSVLPLKPQPVVICSKDSDIESREELHNLVVEEPVCNSWVLDDTLDSGTPGVRVVRTDKASQFWPLEVCSTVCE